ncbi:hypothetical protein R3P38DRAFT_2518906 [Favolaschia claudopus]|uniref:Uncharacterized protein n=2 Tax=Favolaschia claudopus TaxID=2862362 RepID=A0AAW0C755_9AGAR
MLYSSLQGTSSDPEPPLPILQEPEQRSELPSGPKLDDIQYIYHPHSKRSSETCTLREHLQQESARRRIPSTNETPWAPFHTRLDFEVAEFAQENMLNRAATNKLITLIRRCAENMKDLTIVHSADIDKQWDAAAKKCTDFKKYDVVVPYKNNTGTTTEKFDMYARPLWDWAVDLIKDPSLSRCFVWDSVRMFRHNGVSFIRFWNEPWTADALWEIQSKLPDNPDAKPCPFILYADKSKLSSFGTQKAYPIIARLANVVVGIRNSDDWGGGQVVGELPVVQDDTAVSGKTRYVNFKNAVWHASFYKLLESVARHSKTGIWTLCGDGKERWLFPVILILAADYEEASVMTLIRGSGGNHPCAVCLIHRDEQSDLTIIADLRTAQGSKEAVETAQSSSAEAGENLLKGLGLRKVENAFWNVANSDAHHATSFERLHSNHSGLGGDHLIGQVKAHLENLEGRAAAKVDKHFNSFPRWRNLNHFQSVTNISFNDGSKHEDIAKMMVYASHDVLTDKAGFLLLQCLRSYLEVDLYVGLELHTAETIAAGRRHLQKFDRLMKEYQNTCVDTPFGEKNWNFPKMHLQQHAFDDIVRKGASRNFGAKIDESMHAATRAAYLRQTNFKNVTPQILRSLHRTLVAKYIRDQLDGRETFLDDDDFEQQAPSDIEPVGNVVVGSRKTPTSFADLENVMKEDTAFTRFRLRFAEFLNIFLPAFGYTLPQGKRVALQPTQEIIPFQFLKVFFQSLETWIEDADYLRCSPSFHNSERYDAALVKTVDGHIFARLVYVFTHKIEDKTHPFALVQALDVGIGVRTTKDKALGLYRVRERQRKECEFISVHSIVRGAFIVPDFSRKGDYLVVDIIDADMFLRLRGLYPTHISEL